MLNRNYDHPVCFTVNIKINIKYTLKFPTFLIASYRTETSSSWLHIEQKQDYKNTVLYQHGRNATVISYYRLLLITMPSLDEGCHKWKVTSYKLVTSHNIKEIQEDTDCNSSPWAVFLVILSIKVVRYREKC